MDEWYEELDFEENPFSTNPSDYVKKLVARDDIVDELIYRVSSGSIVFIEGPAGSGKSSLLRAVIKQFRGKGKVIYVNSEKFEKKLDVEDLLVQRNGLIKGMFLKQKPSRMILLLDNVSALSYRNMERLKNYFDENFLHSIVFTGESFSKVGFSDSLKQRLENRIIKIPKMTTDQIVEMVRLRLEDSKFLPDEIVTEIAKKFDNNPKEVLNACEELAEFVVGADETVVTEKHLKEVLGVALVQSSKESVASNKENAKPKSATKKLVEKEDEENKDSDVKNETEDLDSNENSEDSDANSETDSEDSDDDLDDFFDDDDDSDDSEKTEKDSKEDSEKDSKVESEDESDADTAKAKPESKKVEDSDDDSEDSDDDLDDFFDDDDDSETDSEKESKEDSKHDSKEKSDSDSSEDEDLESDDVKQASEEVVSAEDEISSEKSSKSNETDADDEKENVIAPIISDDDDDKKKDVKEEDDFFEDSFFEDDEDEEVYDEDNDESEDKKEEDSVFDDFFDDDLEEEK